MTSIGSTLAPLQHRDFRRLWAGTFFATAGQWIQQATLGWVVYEITGSASLLGAVLGIRAVPMLLLAPLTGASSSIGIARAPSTAPSTLAEPVTS